jgi:hypothetical protein
VVLLHLVVLVLLAVLSVPGVPVLLAVPSVQLAPVVLSVLVGLSGPN